ncbi:hypothetical protein PENTCL1PPCAC_26573 [Pristionchus entomophagus]|uniref:G-protein coupled receptors family 1 profile domain-containing protein n=1 Tax=Pristionchus entomophagus TaxID=358040 RepID=A0AAV5UBV8_9BILA|nr:hypothetical protein PENTCL1PPCAC_26573 [Pristionchus entomophagus]
MQILDSGHLGNMTTVIKDPLLVPSFNDSIPPEMCQSVWGFDSFLLNLILKVIELIIVLLCFTSAPLQIYVMQEAVGNIFRKAGDQCLHIFLLSMTLGDFFLTGICYPIELIPAVIETGFPFIVNAFMHIMTWIGLMVSSLSLVLLNVDKLLYFKYPLRYSVYINRTRALSVIAALWIGCASFVISIWMAGCFVCKGDTCERVRLFKSSNGLYLGFMVFVCILPIVSSLLVALYILSVVTKHKKAMAEEQALCRSSNGSNNSHQVKSRVKAFYFIFMSSVLTAVTLLPYRIYNSANIFDQMINDMRYGADRDPVASPLKPCPSILLQYLMVYLLQLNAIVNPLITVTILPQYRLNSLYCWRSPRRPSEVETTNRTRLATDL